MTDQEIAPIVCTPKELDVWTLASRGMSARRIALTLGVSRTTVRDHAANAARKIHDYRQENAA